EVTKIAFGVVHALSYVTLALMAGGLLFLVLVWPAALAAAGDDPGRAEAATAFGSRARRLLWGAIVLGALVSVLGVLLQGASAAGESLWSSATAQLVESTLETRFGWVWGVRALVWVGLGATLALARTLGEASPPGARKEQSGPRAAALLAMGAGALYLVMTPALAGHASVESPRGVFFGSDVIHVGAASVWVGGICFLLGALPAATRRLRPERRAAV